MILSKKLRNKSFVVYGLGLTGISTINCLKRSKVKSIFSWDDSIKKRLNKKQNNKKIFIKKLDEADFIILSPGINIRKSEFSKNLQKNKKKIISDLDIFYMRDNIPKSIVITGTNGKSTTCKIIEHLLKKNDFDVKLGGNIGQPLLDLKFSNKTVVIIEASSFQLFYSRFLKPQYALILNVSKDHLDWHGNMKNYINSKFKVFVHQKKNDFSLLYNKSLIRIFKKKKFISKLTVVKNNKYNFIKNKIQNDYLKSEANTENMKFVYSLSKLFKINDYQFIKTLKNFKGLHHRHEIFYKKKNFTFINDSKATSFEASRCALKENDNIFWIVGGLPKKGEIFDIKKLNKRILKAFIIGKNINFFTRQFKNRIDYEVSSTLKKAINSIFINLKKYPQKKITILLSPSSASYDQFKNFVERGLIFKKLVGIYARKYF